MFDLKDPNWSYFFGFVQTDGHLSGRRGHKGVLSIEISSTDHDILRKFKKLIQVNSSISTRNRVTNFGHLKCSCLRICDMSFRDKINELGLPYGKKSAIIKPPDVEYSIDDYFRGIIDGDGSIGVTAKGIIFLSLVTSSEELANAYVKYIASITGKNKKYSRNKRDNVFNIMITNEDAKLVISKLYYKNCLSLKRKFNIAKKLLKHK